MTNWARNLAVVLMLGMMFTLAQVEPVAAAETEGFAKVQLILKKLRDSMSGLNDLDDLEKAGMSKKDVDRMRSALKRKIDQMVEEAIASIQSL